jgi:hypothetical protein
MSKMSAMVKDLGRISMRRYHAILRQHMVLL